MDNARNLELQYKGFNGRPSDYLLLVTPNFKTVYGRRTFAYNGSRLWNALPVDVRSEESVVTFKKRLKTILFDGHEELWRKAFKYNA